MPIGQLKIGLVLKGRCGGVFDFSDEPQADKKIVELSEKYVVVRNLVTGRLECGEKDDIQDFLIKYLERE
jgi:hypothetical protein